MYDEIKAKLDEEIMDQLSVLSDMDVGSDKRKTAVDDLVKLYRLRILKHIKMSAVCVGTRLRTSL